MTPKTSSVRIDPQYTGVTKFREALPASFYFDPEHYARELARIWHRNWIYVCRSRELSAARSFRTFALADQSILLVRDDDGVVRAFHNTCRHRGAALCRESEGRFPAAGIVCPYHSWRYSLRGELLQTSSKCDPEGFEAAGFPLYKVGVTEWNGFIFIALSNDVPAFGSTFDLSLDRFDDWKLADLVVGHVFRKTIQCNWKIFWENYNECLHCPAVHPKLVQLVPLFGRAMQDQHDDPQWLDHAGDDDPKYRGGLRRGATTWTMDGKPAGVPFPGLSEQDRKAGHLYLTCLPSAFIVGHVDYVRVVRLLPLGPEQTELSIEYLFLPETLADPSHDIRSAVEFTNLVMTEDASVCELNQRGLRASPHVRGVIMPEEYLVLQFQEWVKSELTRT